MLVLSRKKEQSIVINDTIVVKVIGVRNNKVQLGIEAPKEIPVHRGEVYDAIVESATTAKTDAPWRESLCCALLG